MLSFVKHLSLRCTRLTLTRLSPSAKNTIFLSFSTVHNLRWQNSLLKTACLFQSQLIVPSRSMAKAHGKDKGKQASKELYVDPKLLDAIQINQMKEKFGGIAEQFSESVFQRLCLRLTPDMLMDLEITMKKEKQRLSHIAEVTQKSSDTVAVDLGVNQLWLAAVRDAIRVSGLPVKEQLDGSTIFVTQPKITKEMRQEMVKKGKEMGVKAKKEMDRVYQNYDKKLKDKSMTHFSENDIRNAKELLKQIVKQFHLQVDDAWKIKEKELLN